MTVRKTFVLTDDGEARTVDTIEHEGKLWLVPYWLETPLPGVRKPIRLIRMDSLPHQFLGHDLFGYDLYKLELSDPMPIAVLNGETVQSRSGTLFDVVEAPDISIRIEKN
jgi:hypothetical protein